MTSKGIEEAVDDQLDRTDVSSFLFTKTCLFFMLDSFKNSAVKEWRKGRRTDWLMKGDDTETHFYTSMKTVKMTTRCFFLRRKGCLWIWPLLPSLFERRREKEMQMKGVWLTQWVMKEESRRYQLLSFTSRLLLMTMICRT